MSFPVFAAIATVFFYPHIFAGSVGRRILLVVPVDTLYRTSIISSSTVLPLNHPFVNLSLAPLFLFLIYGPDLGVWPDCWVSAEFLRAPIPRKGPGSTTTTNSIRKRKQKIPNIRKRKRTQKQKTSRGTGSRSIKNLTASTSLVRTTNVLMELTI